MNSIKMFDLCRPVMVLLCLAVSASMVHASDVIEQVVVVVDNDPIMLSELETQLQIALVSMQVDSSDSSRVAIVKEQILEQAIAQRVLYQEAIGQGYSVTDEEILTAVDDAITRNKTEMGSDALFQVQLQREGLTEEDLRNRYAEQARTEIITGRLIQTEVRGAVEVTEEDIADFFEKRKDELPPKKPQYHLQHIMILIKPADLLLENANALATEVAAKLSNGEVTFAEAALRYSDDPNGRNGGMLGRVESGDFTDRLGEDFETALFELETGAISQPMRSPLGFHLITIEAKAPDGSWIEPAHILFGAPINEADITRAETEASDIRQLILDGASFTEMAIAHSEDVSTASEGGELGWLPEEALAKPILDTLAILSIGDISGPVRGGDAFHIFNYLAMEAGGEYNFDEVKEELRSWVENEKLEERYRTWLEEIKSRHFIDKRAW